MILPFETEVKKFISIQKHVVVAGTLLRLAPLRSVVELQLCLFMFVHFVGSATLCPCTSRLVDGTGVSELSAELFEVVQSFQARVSRLVEVVRKVEVWNGLTRDGEDWSGLERRGDEWCERTGLRGADRMLDDC